MSSNFPADNPVNSVLQWNKANFQGVKVKFKIVT